MLRFFSWNVNGLRAILKKDFLSDVEKLNPDLLCLQEIKLQEGQTDLELEGYHSYWNYAEKKGYSGVAVFSKQEAKSVAYGMGIPEHDTEGRLLTLDFGDYYLVNCYTPNSQNELRRLAYRMEWEEAFREYLCQLKSEKPLILCGDLNVAHNEIDLKNPDSNHKSAGFSDEERAAFSKLLESGFVDSFRHFYPDLEDRYSWWSYRTRARSRNAGWRIDYFVVSEDLVPKLLDAEIHDDIMGSDHCPVSLTFDIANKDA
ncbi:MAG: exodeoxyribonuclease III [Eubacteriales bacterium]|nr:exodeoxyribonuclease III [Eubacteriales bacterium]